MPLFIIIMGPPAAGTQCEYIKEKFGVIHLSTGDMLRDAVKKGTELGKQAKGFMDKGELVPDELIKGIVKSRLEQEDCKKKGWLLDGFPRTGPQSDFLVSNKLVPNVVLDLKVPDETVIERAVGRRIDPITGIIYHLKFRPPPDEEVAKRCKHRSDDTREAMVTRLKFYHENVKLVAKNFDKLIKKIDGSQKKEDVSKDIFKILEAVKQ